MMKNILFKNLYFNGRFGKYFKHNLQFILKRMLFNNPVNLREKLPDTNSGINNNLNNNFKINNIINNEMEIEKSKSSQSFRMIGIIGTGGEVGSGWYMRTPLSKGGGVH